MGGISETVKKTSNIRGTRASNSCGRAHGFGMPSRIPSWRRVQYGAANGFAQPRRTEFSPRLLLEDISRFGFAAECAIR
jgi:hypothetical protein